MGRIFYKAVIAFAILLILKTTANAQVHTTYLWHLQQPVYWPNSKLDLGHLSAGVYLVRLLDEKVNLIEMERVVMK